MQKLKYHLTIILLVCIVTSSFAGGGWPQKKKKGFFKLGQSFIVANKYFDHNGDVIDITTLGIYTTSLYGEYGITDRITAIAYVPFFVRGTLNKERNAITNALENEGDEMNAFGDVDLGVKIGITKDKPIAVSTTLILGLPTGENAGGNSGILQSGDGEFNQIIMLDAGKGFNKFYTNVGVGFNNRTNNFSDEFRYTFEIGYTGWNKLIATLKVNGIKTLNNDDDTVVIQNGIFSNRVEYFAFGPELSYKVKDNFGITAYVGFAGAAKRILASPNFGFGVFYTL